MSDGATDQHGEHTVTIGAVRVVVAPGRVVPLRELPPYSIALDGLVQGPQLDLDGRRLSFDHHGDCVRLVTSATCRQVLDALLLGLDPSAYTVYVNDIDADTALAVALLAHPAWVAPASVSAPAHAQRVRALVETVGSRDAHGPAYPVADPALLAEFAASVPLPRRHAPVGDPARVLAGCVTAIAELITRVPATNERPAAPTRREPTFTVTHTGTGWVMATSAGDGFDPVYAAGHTRAVLWRRLPDSSIVYTIGRRSDLVDRFPVGPANEPGTILAALAAREPGWGGGTSVGGAPRHPDGSRSALTPDEVFAVVEAVIRQ
ncbi:MULTISPECIES: hypothetical protein [unclassified Frankia]|uniref:hypothetical protein n=1 Tax=unclassified Frankia TaxID=2632575 RepID=UPI001EF428CE|nr:MULTISPECIES: hypothetical protein [unclassified Frankia]